jgi:aminoglycoside phosphotransferase family enzyme/predicted kinase
VIVEDQQDVIAFLAAPATHGGARVDQITTHSAVVFLAGDHAWKLKRAVRYDYLDFSTLDRRKAMCEAELRLNRRTAPSLYRDVVAVTREPSGALALGGSGVAVDWVLRMARFDQRDLFDRLARAGELSIDLVRGLAVAIAQLHRDAEPRPDHGGRAGMAWVVDGNASAFADGSLGLDAARCDELTAAARQAVVSCGDLLEARRRAGFVRQCHGDLHLRNVVRLDGQPTLFDGVEFNDEIACIDVVYDLAFMLMDLWHRGLPSHANALFNAYLAETHDYQALALLPLFLSCRAAVRAKTNATAAAMQRSGAEQDRLRQDAAAYLDLALALLRPPPARLVAIGGLSGTGKSSVAAAIAGRVGALPGAVIIRSDVVRKRLFNVPVEARLDAAAYSDAAAQTVYASMLELAGQVIGTGHSAILDAVFLRPDDRALAERTAVERKVPFAGIWLEAPESVMCARVEARQGDASDADAAVVRAQCAEDPGAIHWSRVQAHGELAGVAEAAFERVSLSG